MNAEKEFYAELEASYEGNLVKKNELIAAITEIAILLPITTEVFKTKLKRLKPYEKSFLKRVKYLKRQ